MSQLCDLLLVQRRLPELEEVDQLLSGIFKDDPVVNEIPAVAFEKFMESYRFTHNMGSQSSLVFPTPLHVAAKFGLNELASRMIDLPDARFAYIPNSHNRYPEEMAYASGHHALAGVLENFHEVGDEFNQIYMAYINSSQGQTKKPKRTKVRSERSSESQPMYLDMSGQKERQKGMRKKNQTKKSSELMYETMESSESMYLAMEPSYPVEPSESMYLAMDPSQPMYEAMESSESMYLAMESSQPMYLDMRGHNQKQMTSEPQSLYLDMSGPNDDSASAEEDEKEDASDLSSYEEIPPEINLKRMTCPVPQGSEYIPVPPQPGSVSDNEVVSSSYGAPDAEHQKQNKSPAQPPHSHAAASCPPVNPKPENAVSAPSSNEPADSQKELIEIMEQVKHKELTMEQAEHLFLKWQMRHDVGSTSSSFQNKQKQLAEMKVEVQHIKESSAFGSLLSALHIGGKGGKKNTLKAAKVTDVPGDQPSATKPARNKQLSTVGMPDSPRSSINSSSSRDSCASRSSTRSSGVDSDMPMFQNLNKVEEEISGHDAPETPPIPARTYSSNKGPDYGYIKVMVDEVPEGEYIYTAQGQQHHHLPVQMSMPETETVRVSDKRKQSCPEILTSTLTKGRKALKPPTLPRQAHIHSPTGPHENPPEPPPRVRTPIPKR
jgi:hypothetical protein